jgi:hypothetical protein
VYPAPDPRTEDAEEELRGRYPGPVEPKRDMDERVNSEADPIDLIKAFLGMSRRDEEDDEDDEAGEIEFATD